MFKEPVTAPGVCLPFLCRLSTSRPGNTRAPRKTRALRDHNNARDLCKLTGYCWNYCSDANVGLNLSQIVHKWDKSETFQDQFQYILALRAKMYWIWSLNVPDLSHFVSFWANLEKALPSLNCAGGDVSTCFN